MMKLLLTTGVLFGVLLIGGCRVEDYNVIIKNVGKRTIDDAHVIYGEFRSIGGILPSGIYAGHGHPEYPIPEKATVEWRTEDGQMHRKDVDVKKLIPKRFRGDIQFEIADDNTVTVRVIPREDLKL
ncbi:MAG: hypothetical protein PHR77_09360 [Kiritimatiellae bacterium]|nr:hypothetical protein [Kiritimatiellia bacterium]MDD5522945.1 hypothetical protein [Kiritimatiellia bacterium]